MAKRIGVVGITKAENAQLGLLLKHIFTNDEVYNSLQSGIYSGVVIFPAPYYGFKFGEVAKYYTTMGWGSVVAYPLAANNKFWAKLPAEIKKIINIGNNGITNHIFC